MAILYIPRCPGILVWKYPKLTVTERNGIKFQVWCQRNIIEYTDPLDWSGKFAAVMNLNKRGQATFQDCLVSSLAN